MKNIDLKEIAKQNMPISWDNLTPVIKHGILLAMKQACEETLSECAENVVNCCDVNSKGLREAVNYTNIQIIGESNNG